MKNRISTLVAAATLFAFILHPSPLLAQGSLTPPGAPAPTMKTLQQVEPRTPVTALPFVIAESGSYYLTTNLTQTQPTNGIMIRADNVTLDLNGFALIGTAGSLAGILQQSPSGLGGDRTNVTVRNGAVRSWGGAGIALGSSVGCQYEWLLLTHNGSTGLAGGIGSRIQDCIARANGGPGIAVQQGSIVTRCQAITNSGDGINVTSRSIVTDSVATLNGADGIQALQDSTITGCITTHNGSNGVNAGTIAIVQRCRSGFNRGDGILASSQSLLTDNLCDSNGTGTNGGAGIRVTGGLNRVQNNHLLNADWGLVVTSTGNFVVQNTARSNATNYVTSGTQTIGPIITNLGVIITNNPWANFSF